MNKAGQPHTVTKAQPVQGAAAVLVLAAVLGSVSAGLATLWLSGSFLMAALAYVAGGMGLVLPLLAMLWLGAKPQNPCLTSVAVQQAGDSLVFTSRDNDLVDRVNVNRTPHPEISWTPVPAGSRVRLSLAVQIGLGVFVLLALIGIDHV